MGKGYGGMVRLVLGVWDRFKGYIYITFRGCAVVVVVGVLVGDFRRVWGGGGGGWIFLLDYIYNNLTMLDLYEFVKRLIKYVVLGIVIAIVAFSIPKKTLNVEEITFIALSAAASFAILDVFAPSIGNAARQGAGFGIGAGIVGGLPIR